MSATAWIMPDDGAHTVHMRFIGKPVRMLPRNHSETLHTTANASTRPAIGVPGSRAANAASAGNNAKPAERPITAGATSQPKREGSVSRAAPIQ